MKGQHFMKRKETEINGLYSPSFEKDSCGFGLIANMDDKPSHWVIQTSIKALQRLTHRGAIADDGKTSDGCGILIKKPDLFCQRRIRSEQGKPSLLWEKSKRTKSFTKCGSRSDTQIAKQNQPHKQ